MKTTPYAVYQEEMYIKAKYAGMSFTSILIDRVPFYYLDKRKKTPWLKMHDAIHWHKNEIRQTNGQWPSKILNLLLDAQQRFEDGEMATT